MTYKAMVPSSDGRKMVPAMTRLELLEKVNDLNKRAGVHRTGKTYWTVTALYNTVIWEADQDGEAAMHEVIEGVPT